MHFSRLSLVGFHWWTASARRQRHPLLKTSAFHFFLRALMTSLAGLPASGRAALRVRAACGTLSFVSRSARGATERRLVLSAAFFPARTPMSIFSAFTVAVLAAVFASIAFTGLNVLRCIGVGPCCAIAAMWAGVPYPLWTSKPYCGYWCAIDRIIRSRVTLATMDAAAIEYTCHRTMR